MQIDTNATDTTAPAAPLVDLNAPPAPAAPASAAPAEDATIVDTSTTTAPAEGEDGKQQEEQQEQDRNDKGQFKSGTQKRIDALVYQRNQAEREAAYWRQQAQTPTKADAPKVDDFDSFDAYEHAMQQHRIDEGVQRATAKTAEQQADRFTQQAQSAAAETYNQRVSEAVTRMPDFAEVVGKSTAPMSPALQEALMESDKGPDLVYHLAKNPAEAERLNNMSVRQMDREIGRLESTIGAKAPAPPAARTTNAPPPVKPSAPAAAPFNEDPSKMTQTQYETWRRTNGARLVR